MTFRTTTLALALAAFAATALAAAKTAGNSFLLVDHAGKTIGNASYTIDKTKDGFKVKTRFEYHIPTAVSSVTDDQSTNPDSAGRTGGRGAALLEGQYTAEYKVNASGNFLSGFTQNLVNQMMTSFEPNKKRDAIGIGHMQAGVAGSHTDLPVPAPQFLLAPDFDPSAIQMLLTTALTHPHPDSMYVLIVPGSSARGGDNAETVAIQPAPDSPNGTLDGQPVALKHYLMNFHSGHADLYADANGTLMDAVMGPLDVSYVRAKFALATP